MAEHNSIADEIERLQELHESGALTADEFAHAKAKVLGDIYATKPFPVPDTALQERLAQVEYQNELARIDREWEAEQEQYMVSGKYGTRQLPTTVGSWIGGGVLALMGILALILGLQVAGAGFLVLFGIVFTVLGIAMGASGADKARRYKQAEEAYHQRRSRVRKHL